MNQHTHEMLDEIAARAAHRAVEEMLIKLGIDVTSPIEVQRDMDFVRAVRTTGEAVRQKAFTTTVGVVITAILGIIGYVLFPHLK